MDDFETITANTSVIKIAACLEKIYQILANAQKPSDYNLREIEFLKNQCKSNNVQLSLMSCHTFVRLVENSILDPNNILTMFVSMLPHSSPSQYTAISEGIVSLLLCLLKRRLATLKEDEPFRSHYTMKTQLHPMITLFDNPDANFNDLVNKINGICNHHDRQIRDNSVEYLRPVFLYMLCNPHTLPDSKALWTDLLSLSATNPDAKELIQEILTWSKISNVQNCIFTSIMVMEAVEYFSREKNFKEALDLNLYQILIIKYLIQYGVDPRRNLQSLLNTLYVGREEATNYYNVMLFLMAELLHETPSNYLPEVLRVISFIVVQENCGHQYILNMCLDGIIQWMSQKAFMPPDGLAMAHRIVRYILDLKKNAAGSDNGATSATPAAAGSDNEATSATPAAAGTTIKIKTRALLLINVRNYHPDIALAFDLANLMENFDESEFKDVFYFVDTLNMKANPIFCQRLHLFLRGLFLSHEPSIDCWFKIYQVILEIIKQNSNIAFDFLMTYIFKLANEHNPEIQMELLRGLPQFAVSKDNIAMILNVIHNLTANNATFCNDLYLRLWNVDSRTYPFLIKRLAQPCKNKARFWEYEVAKTHTIRAICCKKPHLHGPDMVSLLSDTLNTCDDESGDLATSLALDAIITLCDSNVVNIVSTWRVLRNKFRNERRPRSLKALYRFFAQVPELHTPTMEFENLVDEALEILWSMVSRPDSDPAMVCEALNALKPYEIGTLLTLRHIPHIYCQNLHISREYKEAYGREVVDLQQELIPGECWVQLLQKIRPECGEAAAELISHHIFGEITGYRSGVYRLPENLPEPRKLQGLPTSSPLRGVISYLVDQARLSEHLIERFAVTNALRSISRKFPKPIPPVDWCFLHSFFHLSFDTRKYCILIAKNQLLTSGTARRLLENFLVEFEPNCFEEDLLLLFSILPEIGNGVSITILKNFVEKLAVYCFKESQLSGFAEGCLFEKFLDSVKYVFMGKCNVPEVLDVFTLIVERYMDSMDIDSRLFERYTEVVAVLNTTAIEGLTSPVNWWEAPVQKLQKATIIRCYLVLYNTKLNNSLRWLNPIIDAFAKRTTEEQLFFYRHLAITLAAFENYEQSCNWVMDMFPQIQALLAESSNKEKFDKVLYLLDIFILIVDVLSGCAIILGNLNVVATQRVERFAIFPESLQYLCVQTFWNNQESRIYDILYNFYKNNALPEEYTTTFKEAIICSHNKPYFETKSIWTKYVGFRK